MSYREITVPVANPTHFIVIDGTTSSATVGYSSLAAIKNVMGIGTESTHVVYVSKDGLDANTGDSIDTSKLTIGSAITAASALISSGVTGVRIEVLDGGTYTENIAIPTLVAVLAPAATLVGTATIDGDAVLHLNRHFAAANSQVMATHGGATDGPALYQTNVSDGRGTGGALTGVQNVANSGGGGKNFFVNVGILFTSTAGVGVGDTSTGFGHIHLRCPDLYITGDGSKGIYAQPQGGGPVRAMNLVAIIDHILGIESPTNAIGIHVDHADAVVNVIANEIRLPDNAAYQIDQGGLHLICAQIDGSRTGNPVYEASPFLTKTDTLEVSGDATITGDISAANLGTASASATTDFATAAQGATADTAVQPTHTGNVTITGDVSTAGVLSVQASDSVASFGTELVTNGSFTDSATGWMLGTGWVYGTDNVTVNADAAGALTQSISVVDGVSYYLEFTAQLSAANNALLGVSLGSVSAAAIARTDTTSEQSYAVMLTADTTGTVDLAFSVTALSGTGTITLDNISLKAVTPIPATLLLRNSDNEVVTESRALINDANTVIGVNAGQSNTTGIQNTFLGKDVGRDNTSGSNNTFVGLTAGQSNTTGSDNTFLGRLAGQDNTTGSLNTFLGREAGRFNTTGSGNTFVGRLAGRDNTTGFSNTFVGRDAGRFAGAGTVANVVSDNSIMLGQRSRASASGNTNETVIGFDVVGAGSNTVTLGNNDTTLQVLNADTLRLTKKRTIASANETGTMGDMCWDDDYFYVCIDTNTWKRTALTSW